jgi:sensor histidine kinase YesM
LGDATKAHRGGASGSPRGVSGFRYAAALAPSPRRSIGPSKPFAAADDPSRLPATVRDILWRVRAGPAYISRMIPSISSSPRFVPNPWNKSVDLFVLTIVFCALIAAVVTLGAPSFAAFTRWLLIIESIGIAAATIGTLFARLPWMRRHTPTVAHLIIIGVAIPTGWVAGSSFAYTLLGEPLPVFDPGPRRIIALIAGALAGIFIVYLDAMRHRIAHEAEARSEAQRLAMESQLRLLRAQLEPHMLFNTLANVRSLVDVDAKLAQSMIDQLIVYLRSALTASREQSTTLRNEFAQLRAYLEIMGLRMGARLKFRLELPDALQQVAIPPMLLQPLVENAIKHGLEPKIGAGEIEVKASRSSTGVEIAITDTGLGLPPDEEPDDARAGTSYGLVHVRERLRAFYGPNATLSLTRNQPQGVCALVRIPS